MKKQEALQVIRRLKKGEQGLQIAHDLNVSAYETCMIEESWKAITYIYGLEERKLYEEFRKIGKYMIEKKVKPLEVAVIMGITENTALRWEQDEKMEKWMEEMKKETIKRSMKEDTAAGKCLKARTMDSGEKNK